jgi:hypothetical protein
MPRSHPTVLLSPLAPATGTGQDRTERPRPSTPPDYYEPLAEVTARRLVLADQAKRNQVVDRLVGTAGAERREQAADC